MSSLEIAELPGKQHAHVIRDIRSLLAQGVSQSNFGLSSYKQPQPRGGYKELPCFELTKKDCLILASGYDAVLREKSIVYLKRMRIFDSGKPTKVPKRCYFVASLLPTTFDSVGFLLIINWLYVFVYFKHIKFHFTSEF